MEVSALASVDIMTGESTKCETTRPHMIELHTCIHVCAEMEVATHIRADPTEHEG